jgi:ABC-type polysaccharide/polyol phosphate export permease
MLNPITALIDGFRRSLLEPLFPEAFSASLKGQPPSPLDWPVFFGAGLLCVVIAWSGYEFFNRRKWLFVERG